ncbi:DNA-directed RNA polymerase I subunit RPA2 [Toxocara canis]|uniref:DNA-directed RNA polymerase subunit beta n=1 Tax=Toxocara canis TaxID=6265 RepID=A0A0B2V3K4_TOXCA|nr:DNA-directed RNA polymerase I subunit RPA2 [Toxocara canis]
MDCDIASYHVSSFDYLADEGLHLAALDVPPEKFRLPTGEAIEMKYNGAQLGYPSLETSSGTSSSLESMKIYPSECRQRGTTYRAPLKASIEIRNNGVRTECCECVLGEVPVMLMSSRCHLRGLSRSQLVAKGEEGTEKGGYFIVKGSEKVIRLLVANRRNFPIAIVRRSFKEKGKLFTQYGVMMRCIRENHSAAMITLHYLETGAITVALQFRRELFYVPLMYVLKALVPMNDACIRDHLMRARPNDHFWAGCVTSMLAICQEDGVTNQEAALTVLGTRFRVALEDRVGPWENSIEVGRFLLRACVAIHLSDNEEKFFLLVYMAQKLIALAKGECAPETPDNPQFQEAAVSGHIMLLIIRERMENVLGMTRRKIESEAKRKMDTFTLTGREVLRALGSHRSGEITRGLEYFLATGNLMTKIGLALQQSNGFSVIAERINQLRFVSHFRAIHRGAFFMEMRTTDVRKLRPEAWGFICPVHTPDGAPCGLLNHVTASVRIVTHYSSLQQMPALLAGLGVLSHSAAALMPTDEMYPVFLDGRFVGYVPRAKAGYVERQLRAAKVNKDDKRVPYVAEIALVRHSPDPVNIQTQYPGLYILSDPARMIRPVRNLVANVTEFIGTFEQVYLSICIEPEEAEPGVTMHQELHPSCLFSFAGNLIPFPDHNQSPRNVYQCQMGKQTMGTPVHAWNYRADNKMYRLQGYDMEDAMVINKSSFQRGFAHGTVIKVERVNLQEGRITNSDVFMADPRKRTSSIGDDGLPIPGRLYMEGDPYYTVLSVDTGTYKTHNFKYAEPAYCGLVRIVEEGGPNRGKCHALIQWRIQRNPIIGDKFASRHGQKGINSFLWPAESMPFSESGMVPDIIFNPHGFPSRMTIGMMIESMAGKAAAMHGACYDASPFVFNEKRTAIDHFGKLLTLAGYNYYGNETMYSGVDGREMEVQIFFGIVYYQRLRHMIADKFQVRSTGPIDPVTLQPVKGRKKGGGIRFGEMERDAMIAHGASFSLQDRLFNSSDRDFAHVCARCGSLISVLRCANIKSPNDKPEVFVRDHSERERCLLCDKDDQIYIIEVPRVFRYLTAELAAMNVRVQLSIKHPSQISH